MREGLYRQLAAIEDKHWWFVHRRRLVGSYLKSRLPSQHSEALDIGCGTGGNLGFLKTLCTKVTGLEKSPLAIELAKEKGNAEAIVQGDANYASDFFAKDSFDLITIFNVLYHQWVESEEDLIRQMHALNKKDGYLVVSEPAFNFLFRAHDESGLGKRRYTRKELESLLIKAGYRIKVSTYFNSFSFLPLAALSWFHRFFPGKVKTGHGEVGELKVPPTWLNHAVGVVCRMEQVWINLLGRMPVGVTVLCVAQKN